MGQFQRPTLHWLWACNFFTYPWLTIVFATSIINIGFSFFLLFILFQMQGQSDPYEVAKSMGIFQLLESPKSITTTSVAQRIIANHEAYMVYLFFCNCFSWHEWPEIHQIVSHASKSDWDLIFHALQWEKYVKEGPTKIFWNDSTLCRILVQLCCDVVHILSSALLISRVIT